MLSVHIICSDSQGWIDHLGNRIDRLVFSKSALPLLELATPLIGQKGERLLGQNNERLLGQAKRYAQGSFSPGIYPLESCGSLYRNIDNFRESPLQSRTDWEIAVPSVYTSPDGSFKTVDLLYYLESKNEKAGLEFDLIGCEATLFDDDKEIYNGMVESITSGGATSTIRISDWLGTPKIWLRQSPVIIGKINSASKWPVTITKGEKSWRLEISSRALGSKPSFYLKLGTDEFAQVKSFEESGESRQDALTLRSQDSWKSAVLYNERKPERVYEIYENVYFYTPDLLLNIRGLPVLRPEGKDTPDYYTLGDNDLWFEYLEAWSNRATAGKWDWEDEVRGYSVGREQWSEEKSALMHYSKTPIRKIPEPLAPSAAVEVFAPAKSITLDASYDISAPPYQSGSPSFLYQASQYQAEAGQKHFNANRQPPTIKAVQVYRGFIDRSQYYIRSNPFSIKINLASSDNLHGNARISAFHAPILYLAISYKSCEDYVVQEGGRIADSFGLHYRPARAEQLAVYHVTLKVGGASIELPKNLDGSVVRYELEALKGADLSSALKIELEVRMEISEHYLSEAQVSGIEYIEVKYARASYVVSVPITGNDLYVSGEEFSGEFDGGSGQGVSHVKSAIAGLLEMADVRAPIEGDTNALLYGTVMKQEAFALRDWLRTLAAESATLIRFNPARKQIMVADISLQNYPHSCFIPLEVFLHEGIYSFKMESPDRIDLMRDITINWGRDFGTKEYSHSFSADARSITWDGKEPDSYFIDKALWQKAFSRMQRNYSIGTSRVIDSEWVTSWEAAENMAYNLLRWNTAPMRKAQAKCIFTALEDLSEREEDNGNPPIDIGTFVHFDLPGYPEKFAETSWVITGRHDDLDGMVTTLELLEARDLPAVPPNRILLLEDGRDVLLEDGKKIKLEDVYG